MLTGALRCVPYKHDINDFLKVIMQPQRSIIISFFFSFKKKKFTATPAAYGSSWARGRIGAASAMHSTSLW